MSSLQGTREKVPAESGDVRQEQLAKLRRLFPEVFAG